MSGKKPPAHFDHAGRWLVTFVYYTEDGQQKFDTVIHDDTLTSLLLELNEYYATPSIVFAIEVSKTQYAQLEAALDAVDPPAGDVEEVVDIGAGYKARIPPDMDAAPEPEAEGDGEPEDDPAGGDPDELDEGNADLERDGPDLDEDDLDGEFDED